jgi:hypothetical protein
MMSNSKRIQDSLKSIVLLPQKVVRYIAEAGVKIFSPTQDDYPETGVQPFTGDPGDKSH